MKTKLLNTLSLIILVLFVITTSLCKAQSPTLYGMTNVGGKADAGIIFNYDGATNTETDVHDFANNLIDGNSPDGSLVLASNGLLYGMTSGGGAYGYGTIFSYNITTGIETFLHDFDYNGIDGINPLGSLMQASNGLLYGMTLYGGSTGYGTIFSYNISTGKDSVLYSFYTSSDGYTANPHGSLIQATNGLLYGMTTAGGINAGGTILSYNITTVKETDLHDFGSSTDGKFPFGTLLQAANGLLYGMTYSGGTQIYGTILSYDITTGKETDIHDFVGNTDGQYPYGSLIQATNGLLYGVTFEGSTNLYGTVFSYDITTGKDAVLHGFGSYLDGYLPYGSLLQASNGLLYGMTYYVSAGNDSGAIFSYNITTGKDTVVHNFSGSVNDGASPLYNSLIQGSNGLLYGMTPQGGANNDSGTIFNYNITSGKDSVLHSFGSQSGTDGKYPVYGSLVKAGNGLLYGLTDYGGTNGYGTIFSYKTSKDTEIVLYNFGSSATDGQYPLASIIQGSNGLLYGLTSGGGVNDGGTIFSYNITTGKEIDIFDFGTGSGTNGSLPWGSVMQASNGLLYGMTEAGGINSVGTIFSYNITTGIGTYVYNFGASSTDGQSPNGSLIQASNGLLYGMTKYGGANGGEGTIFSYNISATTETDIHDFGSSNTDGQYPHGALIQAGNGLFYGMTREGGINDSGTIFSFNITTQSYSDLHDFGNGTDGRRPYGSLIQAGNGLLYGLTSSGGTGGTSVGTIFSYNISTASEIDIHDFDNSSGGRYPYGSLFEDDTIILQVTPLPAVICEGGNINLKASGASTYSWSPSTGLSATTGDSIIANPTVTTTYTLTGTTNGQKSTITVTVTVSPNPTITVSPSPASYCSGGSSTLTASGGSTYTWSPSTDLSATTGAIVTANPTIATTYTVTGTNSSGCSGTKTVTVTVNPNPTIAAAPSPTSYCSGGSSTLTASGGSTYTWSPSTDLSATTGATVSANPTVTTTYTVTGTNLSGCSETKTVTVTVNPNPTVTASPSPTSYCPGGSSTLTASGGNSYTWSPSTNLSATTGITVKANPTVTTTYIVTGTNSSGCSATNTVTVTVNQIPTITASPSPASYCSGGSSTLTASGGNTYTWSPSTNLSSTDGATVSANPTVTTTYTVTGTNLSGCSGTNMVTVTVNPSPIITTSAIPASYCPGGSSILKASGGTSYSWAPSTGLSTTTGDSVTTTIASTTTYTVSGTGTNGCVNTKTVTVTVDSSATITSTALPLSYCVSGSSTLIASGGLTYIWSPSTGLSATTGGTVIASPTVTTTYTIDGSSGVGCTGTTSVIVTVNSAPIKPNILHNGDTLTSSATQGNQWVHNDSVLQGATSQTYIVSITGCYSVTTTNGSDSCSATSDTSCVTVTGINQLIVSGDKLSIFPNPTSNTATINFSISEPAAQLVLLNVLGQVVYTKMLTPFSGNNYNSIIDLTNMPSGLYNICIKTSTEIINAKIVKQY